MEEQRKIKRIMRLIKILLENPKTINQLEHLLEVSKATAYRYIKLLNELGYEVDIDNEDRYFIFNPSFHQHSIFNKDEIIKLKHLLSYINNPSLAEVVEQKLENDIMYPSSEFFKKIKSFSNLETVIEAIDTKHWIRLLKYHSSNSNSIKDKIVFPLKISEHNPKYFVAWDNDINEQRIFKTFRMEGVEILKTLKDKPKPEKLLELDMFGMANAPDEIVKLQLTERAKSLLEEEYPIVLNLIEPNDHDRFPYRLILEVKGFEGIGRFILGLPGEILIEQSPALTQYLKERISQFGFLTN